MPMLNVLSFKRTLFVYHFVFLVPLTSIVPFVQDLPDRKLYTALPNNIRFQLSVSEAIYLRPVIRCCKSHISDNTLKLNPIEKIRCQYPLIVFTSTSDIMNVSEELTTQVRKGNFSTKITPSPNFNNSFLYPDEECWVMTGVYRKYFDLITNINTK